MGKMKSNGGFSLLEMLMTMLILSFTMVTLVNGSVSIKRLYSDALRKADAQMLLSQVETTLRNDLSFARKCTVNSGDNLTVTDYWVYFNHYTVSDLEKRFITGDNARRLENVSIPFDASRYPEDHVTIQYDGEYFTVSGLKVLDKNGKTVQSGDGFIIRALSDVQSGN